MIKKFDKDSIKELFDPQLYKKIPVEYLIYISIKYSTGKVVIITQEEIENIIPSNHNGFANIEKLYHNRNIDEIEIELNFDKLAKDVNNSIEHIFGIID